MLVFRPKLFDALHGYNRATFLSDLAAGVTVGVVALPLAIGFAIASGVEPSRGLWTAIIAGFVISALGGSLVQVGGPTGAFVPILFAIVARYGYDGLVVATIMAGVMLVAMGALKLGNLIKFIPYPVTSGFTSGIAVIVFVGQLKEFLGLTVKMPAHTPEQVSAIAQNLAQTQWPAVGLGVLALAILMLWPKAWRRVPASIVAVVVTTVLVAVFQIDVPTIGSKFGGIPRGLPNISFPKLNFLEVQELMIPALTITMLGAIESLLSAIVADGMIESRHDSNQELMGQGVANVLCPFFGGISATGAIARTATNIRSGAKTPVAGMIHSITLLLIVLIAAPLAKSIPLTALSAVLLVVAYRMGEWENFPELWRGPKSDFMVLVVTFGLTVVFDLTIAVGVGLTMAGALFVKRMEEITQIRLVTADSELDVGGGSIRDKEIPKGVLVYRIEGPFFFGAAEKLEAALERYSTVPRVVIFRMRTVPAVDATGLHALEVMLDKFHRKRTQLILSGVQPQPMKVLFNAGFIDKIGLDNVCANIDAALARAGRLVEGTSQEGKAAP
ncbi:MAG TPA: SulP family inorganic anion transporter [Verrucomicrobiae bacterium]|nr:SulP family inorganic anion transporter [Verrucomicrobiae bacterium]